MLTHVALAACILVALATRARLGFGFSLVFVPLAAVAIGLDQAVPLAIALEVASGIMMAIEHRARLRLIDAILMKVSSYGGLIVGAALRSTGLLSVLVVLAMAVIASLCTVLLIVPRRMYNPSKFGIGGAGFLSGMLNSWTSLGGPPVVLYYMRTEDDDRSIKGALTGYFVLLYIFTFIVLLASHGYAHFRYWGDAAFGGVLIVAGFRYVAKFVHRMPGAIERPSLALILCSAILILLQVGITHSA